MADYTTEFAQVISSISRDLGRPIDMSKIHIMDRGVPHQAPKWEEGYMAVYTFNYKGNFLKIGKAGPKSKARFISQHYNPKSAMSTLAASIINDIDMRCQGISESNVGDWIKCNCRRIDILIPTDMGIFTLELIESALHYKYEPKYEGFDSQR